MKLNLDEQAARWRQGLETRGYAALAEHEWTRPAAAGEAELVASYGDLRPDRHMGDGGTYRLRRFSRFRWTPGGPLTCLDDSTIYQDRVDNPLNGGQLRRFEPLDPAVAALPFLQALIEADARQLGLETRPWNVGIHCVRILARPAQPGQPTPEGVHRDAEQWTVQHLIERRAVSGGVFTGHFDDENRLPRFHWKQLQRWDTLFFGGKLWHSATPIHSASEGHRDILLVDFDPA